MLSFAGFESGLTVPGGWAIFENRAPPWVVPKEAILGLASGEERPKAPYYRGAGPMSTGSWYENDLSKGLVASASHGEVPPQEIIDRLVGGYQFMPATRSGLWSTWHKSVLRALSSLFASWSAEAANPALKIEAAYASETFGAMAAALGAVDTSHGSPRIDPEDPVLGRAVAYTASVVSWLDEHDEEIVDGMITYLATGVLTPALASGLGTVVTGAAALGPIGIAGLSVAIIGVAVYAFVTGARPGNTLGAGDDVLAFPRSGTDPEHITYLRPVDVDAYTHAMYRAVLLDRQRKVTGTRPWRTQMPKTFLAPVSYHHPIQVALADDVVEEELSKGLVFEEEDGAVITDAPLTVSPMVKKVVIGAAGAGALWWLLKSFGVIGRRKR